MKKSICLLAILLSTVGCQHFVVEDISQVDVSSRSPSCVRECAAAFSSCIAGAFGASAQNSCASGYKVCVSTCPSK